MSVNRSGKAAWGSAKHRHIPASLPNDRNDELNYRDICTICGQPIERTGPREAWGTEVEIEEWFAEQQAEAKEEWEREQWDLLHPEDRCPPRE